MSSERHARLRDLFDAALEQPESDRLAFVRANAGDDRDLANDVIELLGYGEDAKLRTQGPWQMLAEAQAEPLPAGKRLGRYELFERLGAGGMGQVYRARRVDDTAQWVAVKVIRPELTTPEVMDRFRAERQILARLNHPGIAHFLDADTDADGTVFVVMELVDGKPLLEFANTRALDLDARVALFRQLLSAVSHAHGQLIIHRDIKAANVLVREDGAVKLLDFGIGKLLDDAPAMTATRDRLFTPLSAAPEQIRGESCDVTTDVYALGVLLYELLAGQPMFDAGDLTPGEYERLVLEVPPAPMRSRRNAGDGAGSMPQDLEDIVQKALRKERSGRYPSVEQFDADLGRFLANEPVSVAGSGKMYRARKFVARHRVAVSMTAITAAAVVIAFGVTLIQNRTIRAERDRANLALGMMKDAFISADPSGVSGGDVSARHILERSANSLKPMAVQQPGQFADLAAVLVEVQLSMGLVQDAEAIVDALGATTATESPRLCLLKARLLAEQRRLTDAESRLESCAPVDELSADDRLFHRLVEGRIAIGHRKYPEAAAHFKALANALSPGDPMWIHAQQQSSVALAQDKRLAEALASLDRAQIRADAVLAVDHPARARLQLARLEAMSLAGDQSLLMAEGPSVVAQLAPRFGMDSALLGRAQSLVGLGFFRERRYAQALPHLEASFQAFKGAFGDRQVHTLRAELNLVSALAAANGDPAGIRKHFLHLIESSTGPEQHEFREFAQIEYGKWLARVERNDEALALLVGMDAADSTDALASDRTRSEHRQWLNYTYWANECADDPTETYSSEVVCHRPTRTNAVCEAARGLLCPESKGT